MVASRQQGMGETASAVIVAVFANVADIGHKIQRQAVKE